MTKIYTILIMTLWLLMPASANAQELASARTEFTYTEIISEKQGFTPGATAWFAIRQEVMPGWHVFWKNPGDAGLPLALDWQLPTGFKPGAVLYPAPQYIPVGPLASYAHEGEPIFLAPVRVPADAKPGETVAVKLSAYWQVCEEICVPEEAVFEFSLPVTAQETTRAETVVIFVTARNALPSSSIMAAHFKREGARYLLVVEEWQDRQVRDVFFFPAVEGLTTPSAEQTASIGDGLLRLAMQPGWTDAPADGPIDGVLTFQREDGSRRALSISAVIDGSLMPPQPTPTLGLGLLFGLAFLGGVILNAMPCVFPIIFVKAANLMQSAHGDRRKIRAHGLLYTAGILVSFMLTGGLLLALRAGGEQVGWGFHLQSPLIVGLSAYALLLVGLSLAGVFTIGENIAGSGQSLAAKEGASGSFFTGVLAVVVAAPCIGPLLSAPMGAALLQPPAIGMVIFVFMGLGLAAPYLAISFIPVLGRVLPKPGAWMSIFKHALAFPVFGAAAYFLWVFSRQTDANSLAVLLTGALLLSFSAWLFEISKGDGVKALIIRGAAALAAVLAIAPLTRIDPQIGAVKSEGAYGNIETEPYSALALTAYRAAGRPVFIDFTAAWCVTCQFNKMTVLKNEDVAEVFARSGTIFMVADWTVRDPEVTKALAGHGASGVPLYVYYPPGGEAHILPTTLTRRAVLDALANPS